jgi:hypothetical protein
MLSTICNWVPPPDNVRGILERLPTDRLAFAVGLASVPAPQRVEWGAGPHLLLVGLLKMCGRLASRRPRGQTGPFDHRPHHPQEFAGAIPARSTYVENPRLCGTFLSGGHAGSPPLGVSRHSASASSSILPCHTAGRSAAHYETARSPPHPDRARPSLSGCALP